MSNKLFAMNLFFNNSLGSYPFETQCEMLKELGYDGIYLCLLNESHWEAVPLLAAVQDRYGIEVARVYANIDVEGDDGHKGNLRVLNLLETVEGCNSIELSLLSTDPSLKPSDPAGDEKAVCWLDKCLKVADRRNLTLTLYHHMMFWMERIEDAVRLCRRMNNPRLGVAFCGYHWFVVDGKDLLGRLDMAAPFLHSANLCGCTMLDKPAGFLPASVQLIHEGALDNFLVLATLKRVGYDGWVGLQGYSIGGDAYGKLKLSIEAFRSMVHRLDEHPGWGAFRTA
jgi:sugar phosphate isomerase/epimerase